MKKDVKVLYLLLSVILVSSTSFIGTPKATHTAVYLGGWVKLGKQVVSEGAYYDTLDIAEEKKNVKRLKLKVQKTSVYILSIKVVYVDGTSENHIVSRRLEKGDSTRAFDLIGHHRAIKKILFTYRSGTRGGAELVVLGKM